MPGGTSKDRQEALAIQPFARIGGVLYLIVIVLGPVYSERAAQVAIS